MYEMSFSWDSPEQVETQYIWEAHIDGTWEEATKFATDHGLIKWMEITLL